MSLQECLDILEQYDEEPDSDEGSDSNDESEIDVMNIGIEPPKAETDRDTDRSDDDVKGNLDYLPRRILCTNVQSRYKCILMQLNQVTTRTEM